MTTSANPKGPRRARGTIAPFAAIAVAHAPLIASAAWLEPAWWFAPLAAIGALALAARDGAGFLAPGRPAAAAIGWALGWAWLGAAVRFGSPWLAAGSATWSLLTASYALGGVARLRSAVPAAAFLFLTAAPPLGLGGLAMERLGSVTAAAASDALDLWGVPHDLEQGVLRLAGAAIDLAPGSCLGWLPAAAAAVAFASLWGRQSTFRLAGRVVTVGAWVTAAEVLRATAVAGLADRAGVDLAVGNRATALGLASVGLALLLTMATDRLMAAMAIGWRWLSVGPGRPTRRPWWSGPLSGASEFCATLIQAVKGPSTASGAVPRGLWVAGAAFLALLAPQPWSLAELAGGRAAPGWVTAAGPDALPPAAGQFRREAATGEAPAWLTEAGARTARLWLYRWGDRTVFLTLRGPFAERSSAADAAGPGWAARGLAPRLLGDGVSADGAELESPSVAPAFAAAVLADRDGAPVLPPAVRPIGLLDRLGRRAAERQGPPTYQIAAVIRGGPPLTEADRDAAYQFLDLVQAALRKNGGTTK